MHIKRITCEKCENYKKLTNSSKIKIHIKIKNIQQDVRRGRRWKREEKRKERERESESERGIKSLKNLYVEKRKSGE